MKQPFNPEKPFDLSFVPPDNIETIRVLRQVAKSRSALAELKGTAHIIPNEDILIQTLVLREAKESSAIENIITTQDDIYKARLDDSFRTLQTKEVENYAQGLQLGFKIVKEKQLLTNTTLKQMQEKLLNNQAGFRTQAGTTLKNQNGKIVYTPPQDKDAILDLMKNLEQFINDDKLSDLDPLVKMAIIHYQFESIHPFYDGNGRVGRMMNILYLILQKLLDTPILYLSSYIIENKTQYYRILQNVRENEDWENMILYLLKGIEITAKGTIGIIKKIESLMKSFKNKMREELPKIYSQDLINNLFKYPYTKIEFLAKDLQIVYLTARKYLEEIVDLGLLKKIRIGRSNYYFNHELIEILRWKT